jgi:hypothetical protein
MGHTERAQVRPVGPDSEEAFTPADLLLEYEGLREALRKLAAY